MFYANLLFTSGLTMTLLSVYICQHSTYRIFMIVAGIIVMLIGTVVGLKIECNNDVKKTLEEERFKELKRLVEAQSEQINLLKEEIDTLKQRWR